MSSIFLSHSQKDKSIIDIFLQAFSDTTVNPILMEYEKFQNPPWNEIRNKIQTSASLFVLLGSNLKSSDYTQNWVSYEIGLADALGRQIWVFEDINNEIIFPIPHVHHYLIYDSKDPDSLNYLKQIVASYAINPTGALVGLVLTAALISNPIGWIIGGLIGSKVGVPTRPSGVNLQCYHQDCQVQFRFYNENKTIRCPSCRRLFGWRYAAN